VGRYAGKSVRINSTVAFTDIQQKTWALVEIRTGDGDSDFIDRQKLEDAGNGDAYTLTIDGERISGKANPNRYFTSYELGEDEHELLLSVVAGTLMWGIVEPGMLLEQDYYTYLQNVNRWDLNGALELATVTQEDQEVTLVFIPMEEGYEG
jgi:heat shock protein HslJ